MRCTCADVVDDGQSVYTFTICFILFASDIRLGAGHVGACASMCKYVQVLMGKKREGVGGNHCIHGSIITLMNIHHHTWMRM